MMRIGQGYDAHRLVVGRDLILGGVKINYDKGLLGHSDADVLVHAIIDSLLGASGLGDIGRHFPPTDSKYLGADSLVLLKVVVDNIEKLGYQIVNIDATIVAQEPHLTKYLPKMQENISKICRIAQNFVNIKATTEEGMGFTGKAEGISAFAVCLVKRSGVTAPRFYSDSSCVHHEI